MKKAENLKKHLAQKLGLAETAIVVLYTDMEISPTNLTLESGKRQIGLKKYNAQLLFSVDDKLQSQLELAICNWQRSSVSLQHPENIRISKVPLDEGLITQIDAYFTEPMIFEPTAETSNNFDLVVDGKKHNLTENLNE